MPLTVIQYALTRLRAIGVSDVFGVPGDFSFPVTDAICASPDIRWIGCCNELNAAYAAEGYARIRGVGALCTTYGVGELSALAGVAGACAEYLPVFHLVGAPGIALQASRAPMHHTLGDGEYGLFRRMSEPVVCAHAVMTPHNVAHETERLIAEALYNRRPVYMAFPADLANRPVVSEAAPIPEPGSDPSTLEAAVEAILEALTAARTACLLPGVLVARAGLRETMQKVVDASGLPVATMFMGKSLLDEQQPAYVGMYDGALMNPDVRDYVEGCDLVIAVGERITDFNTGAFTAKVDWGKAVAIHLHETRVGNRNFPHLEMADVLAALIRRLTPRAPVPHPRPHSLGPIEGRGDAPITAAALYPRWEAFLRPGDIVIAETGTVSMGLGFAHLPSNVSFYNQTLWGSIGWATPAALGAAVAAPGRRIVLFTGEGSHQMTVQDLGQFARLGLKPVVFVLNNNGYLIERLLCRDPEIAYNEVAQWRYADLPHVLGCDGWLSARVTTCEALDSALAAASAAETGVYIEVVTGKYEASPLARRLHESVATLYGHAK